MLLYFLRHGQAGNNYSTDFDRELTNEGISASYTVGKFCEKNHIHFTHVFASPLVRAKQTAEEVLKSFPTIISSETDHLTSEADPRNLFELLAHYSNSSRILLVTHEPFVSTCISQLISGSEYANIEMKTANLACIEIIGSPSRGSGRLRWLLTSDIMIRMM